MGIANSQLNLAQVLFLSQSNPTAVRSLLEECLLLFREVGVRGEDLAESLSLLAKIATIQDDYATGGALYEESLALAREVGDKRNIASNLEGLASVVATQGEPAWAGRLWGAAEALRQNINMPLPPVYRADYEHSVAAARAQLGEKAFAAAWSQGRVMTPEQALAARAMPATSMPARPTATPPMKSPPYPAGLSAREMEVLRLVAQGLTDAQVAEQLVISPRTVNTHLTSIYGKIGVSTRSAATRYAIKHNFV